MVRQKPISFVLCGCPALTAVVSAITGSLPLSGVSLYLDTSPANFAPELITETIIAEGWMTFSGGASVLLPSYLSDKHYFQRCSPPHPWLSRAEPHLRVCDGMQILIAGVRHAVCLKTGRASVILRGWRASNKLPLRRRCSSFLKLFSTFPSFKLLPEEPYFILCVCCEKQTNAFIINFFSVLSFFVVMKCGSLESDRLLFQAKLSTV